MRKWVAISVWVVAIGLFVGSIYAVRGPPPAALNFTSSQMSLMTDQRKMKYRRVERCAITYKASMECR